MTKPQKGFAVITAIVLLIAAAALVKPVTEWVHNKIKYRDFDRYLDIGITAYYENDYAAAYDAYMSAYDSLAAENDFDRDMKAGACQIAAECLGMTGDLYGVIDTLERGYAETEESILLSRLMESPVRFSDVRLHEVFCRAFGVSEDMLTYGDLQKIETRAS